MLNILHFYFYIVQSRSKINRSLEMETWHDLANLYTSLSQWRDAEVCLSKSQAINPHSASRWHSTGILLLIYLCNTGTLSILDAYIDAFITS